LDFVRWGVIKISFSILQSNFGIGLTGTVSILSWEEVLLECTGSVQGTGVDPTFKTAYMHPEMRHKALVWFVFSFKRFRSYFGRSQGLLRHVDVEGVT